MTELAEKLVAHWVADILKRRDAGWAIRKDGANIVATSPDGKEAAWQDFGGALSKALPPGTIR
jgi:hypothetical protein